MKTEREIFARNLRRMIEKNPNLNQARIAAELGVSRGTMSDYTNGKAYPRPSKMTELCKILGVSQYDLTTDHYADEEPFVPNREVLSLAKSFYANAEMRNVFAAIVRLDENEFDALKAFLNALGKKI